MISKDELYYLAGLWDAEGSFMIRKLKKPNGCAYMVTASLYNTNPIIFNEAKRLVHSLGVENVYTENRGYTNGWKDQLGLRIETLPNNRILLQALLDFLLAKREVAEVVLGYILRRLLTPKVIGEVNRDRKGRIISRKSISTYTDVDRRDHEKVKRLNEKGVVKHRSISNITTPPAHYFGGLYDGEGNFSIVKRKRGKKFKLCAVIGLTNSDPLILAVVSKFLEQENVGYLMYQIHRTDKRAACYHIEVKALDCLKRLLELLLPCLVGKKKIANLLYEFVCSRIIATTGKANCQAPYSIFEHNLFEQAKQLNKKGKNVPRPLVEQSTMTKSCEVGGTPEMDNAEPNLAKDEEVCDGHPARE